MKRSAREPDHARRCRARVLVAGLLGLGLALGSAPALAAPPPPVGDPPATTTTAPPTLGLPTTAPPAPAAGASPRYVALGDSWAAGTAAGDVDPASGPCRRSRVAYPALLARSAEEPRSLSRACAARDEGSGNTQFSSLDPGVQAVTATVGADAVGLGELLRACSSAASARDCDAAAARTDRALGTLPRTLDAAIVELRRAAPRAAVTFVGYPLPAEGLTCPAGPADVTRAEKVDATVTRLDAILLERTRAAAVRFVDVRLAFAGHGVCSPKPWLTPLNGPDARLAGGPNAAGHGGFRAAAANAVTAALAAPVEAGAEIPSAPATTTPGAPSSTPAPDPAPPAAPAEGRDAERQDLFAG